jgi:hypothetical protein
MEAVFTIVAKNYIGLAEVLQQSVMENSNSEFFIFVADEFTENELMYFSLPKQVLIAKQVLDIGEQLWNELAFKYNLVEFCTCIKPACFEYLFKQKNFDKVIFFDPDIFVYSNLSVIFDKLDLCQIILTPHILNPQTPFKGNYADYLFLINGTFNLGFLALRNSASANKLLFWWHNRLIDYCFFDNDNGLATDQKWMNMLPAFFAPDVLHISMNKGFNVAPWNYHERRIEKQGELFIVKDRENEFKENDMLTFIHFSSYDYKAISNKNFTHKNSLDFYEDYNPVFEKYSNAILKSNFSKYIQLKYSYDTFENGFNIISLNRRFYRRSLQDGISYLNPFSISENSFYDVLLKKHLIDKSIDSADNLTNKNIKGFESKIKYVNLFFSIVKKVFGIKKYSVMIRFFKRYFSQENQAFLLDKNFGKKLQ